VGVRSVRRFAPDCRSHATQLILDPLDFPNLMIAFKDQFYDWIRSRGVGDNDRVASSPDSYISYLNGVSELLGQMVSPEILSSEEDVEKIARRLAGMRSDGTIRNYKSAMRQYVAMVQAKALASRSNTQPERTRIGSAPPTRPERDGVGSALPKSSHSTPTQPVPSTAHNLYSSYREALLEHLFAAEIMKHLWLRGNTRIETLKPQVDDSGYDLVLEGNGVVRHLQLKSSHLGSSTANAKISLHLAKKPSGCVIWLWFDPGTLQLGPFLYFGGPPGSPLPNISSFPVAKHTKGNAQGEKLLRPNLRIVPKGSFEELLTIEAVVRKLFGAFEPATEV
jgi:hypothetical protein